MSERDLALGKPDEITEWDGATVTRDVASSAPLNEGPVAWVGTQLDRVVARFLDLFARRGSLAEGEPAALTRTGGPLARWISFPRGVRVATAATTSAKTGAHSNQSAHDIGFRGRRDPASSAVRTASRSSGANSGDGSIRDRSASLAR